MKNIFLVIILALFVIMAQACAEQQKPLEGERISVLTKRGAAGTAMPRKTQDVRLPRIFTNTSWTQKARNAQHYGGHLFWHGTLSHPLADPNQSR